MDFGPQPAAQCEGAILAHSLRVSGTRFGKGRILSAADIRALQQAGIERITVARPGPEDLDEDTACAALAEAAAGAGTRTRKPFGGRINIMATLDGLVRVDADALLRCNRVSEAITIAAVADGTRIRGGDLLATIKIIPFAVPSSDLSAARGRAHGLLSVAPFHPLRVAHVLTTIPDTSPKLLERSRAGAGNRISELGGSIVDERTVRHDPAPLAAALTQAVDAEPDLLLISGASAIVDRRDVVPAAIERAGGRVDHFGMPVDPGNLLLIGTLQSARVIGLPGCARAPARNGLDLVLERLAAGLDVDSAVLSGMGTGGLLKKSASRRRPNRIPRIAAVILAAGRSQRMRGGNKLLEPIGGRPLVVRAAEAALASEAAPVIVVTGHQHEQVAAALRPLGVRLVHNRDFRDGLSSSVHAGLSAVPPGHDGAVLMLGDMPDVDGALVDRLLAAFDPVEGRAIVVAAHGGTRGNPVLFARRYFPDILRIAGDTGARHVVDSHDEAVCEIECPTRAPLVDLDTPEALAERRASASDGAGARPVDPRPGS